jgi:hypothetical protein
VDGDSERCNFAYWPGVSNWEEPPKPATDHHPCHVMIGSQIRNLSGAGRRLRGLPRPGPLNKAGKTGVKPLKERA